MPERKYRFSPHYIGSSFSTQGQVEAMTPDECFSPHFISGLLFQRKKDLRLHLYHRLVSVPIISGLLFQQPKYSERTSAGFLVSVPIISGLLFTQYLQVHCHSLYTFQSPLYRVFFFNHEGRQPVAKGKCVSVPIISVFFFNQRGRRETKLRPSGCFSVPHYIGSSFSTLIAAVARAVYVFQSPLYRSSFSPAGIRMPRLIPSSFSPHYIGSSFSTTQEKIIRRLENVGFSPHYIGLLFQLKRGRYDFKATSFQSPLYRVFFFNSVDTIITSPPY